MKYLIVGLSILASVAALVWWLGSRLPVRHHASADLVVHQSPDRIFALAIDVANFPSWRKDVNAVELLPPAADGAQRFRESGSNGSITYRIESAAPPERIITRIEDETLPFGGTWTITILPERDGTRITIVEDGEVKPVFFRFMSHYVFGYHETMNRYLTSLATHFGEKAEPREI